MQESSTTPLKPVWHYALLIAVPLLLLWGIVSMSPNFDFTRSAAVRSFPPGGDYLQEHVGGVIITSDLQPELYELRTFQGLQHIEALVGVQWDESQYFPPVYPPFWYAAVSPLSQLDYALAVHLWAALMTVCLIVSLLLLYKFTETPLPLLLAFCVFTPVIHSISSGQKGTLLLLIFTASFALLKTAQPAKSGVVFALSLFKPYLGVCVGLLMLISGRWRWVAATLLSVAAIAFGSWWTWPELSQDYLEVCLGFGDYVKSSGYDLHKSYSLWSGWQLLIPHGTTAKVLTVLSSLAVIVGALVCLRPSMRGKSKTGIDGRREFAFAVMILVMAVTAPHFYYYDLTVLILPASIFAGRAKGFSFQDLRWLPVMLIAVAMLGSGVIMEAARVSHVPIGTIVLVGAIYVCLRRL